MNNLTEQNWAWIAGLIEGEGCISITNSYPVLQIQMTDKDVMEKLALLLEVNLSDPIIRKKGNSKPTYQIALRKTEKLKIISDKIYDHMGQRRKKSIENWREYWHKKYYKVLHNPE
jgi:hypothetical protein